MAHEARATGHGGVGVGGPHAKSNVHCYKTPTFSHGGDSSYGLVEATTKGQLVVDAVLRLIIT